MKPIFDSHCHIDMVMQRGMSLAEITAAMQEHHVGGLIQIGADYQAMQFSKKFCHEQSALTAYYTVGCHPEEAPKVDVERCLDFARENAQDQKFKAIGEVGLEYHYSPETKDVQKKVFYQFCSLATELKRPVCIHTRDAHEDTLAIVKEFSKEVTFLLHCFTGNHEQMSDYLEQGCYISFSGIVTFKNAQALQQAALYCPLDKILVETDAPFLTPVPLRGKLNHPALTRHTLRFIANLRAIEEDTLAEATFDNTKKFYRI